MRCLRRLRPSSSRPPPPSVVCFAFPRLARWWVSGKFRGVVVRPMKSRRGMIGFRYTLKRFCGTHRKRERGGGTDKEGRVNKANLDAMGTDAAAA